MSISSSLSCSCARQNEDLMMKMELSISEALCGFKKVITTLDNRELVVATIPGNKFTLIGLNR